jgi:hypothetical protein
MNMGIDPMLQAEIDYRVERIKEAWGPIRRGRAPRRHGRNATRRERVPDFLG